MAFQDQITQMIGPASDVSWADMSPDPEPNPGIQDNIPAVGVEQAVLAFEFSLFNSEHPFVRQGALKALWSLLTQHSRLSKADVKAAAKDIMPSVSPQILGMSRQGAPVGARQTAVVAPRSRTVRRVSISTEEAALRTQYGPDYADNSEYQDAIRDLRNRRKGKANPDPPLVLRCN
jgi:hypothetical protein